jgi:predicted branched-subunit amino acid permease
MRRLPGLPPAARLPWFLGFALVAWSVAGATTAAGHGLAPLLDRAAIAALVFANPLYFALLLAAELRQPAAGPGSRLAILAGALASPAALLLPPAWALLGAGLLGGSLAFCWTHLSRRGGHGRG